MSLLVNPLKVIYYIKKLKFIDLLRKVCYWFNHNTFQKLLLFFRRIRLLFFLKTWLVNCGKNITVKGLPFNIRINRKITISDNCVFEFGPESEFKVGYSCFISYGVVISCMKRITIGDYVQIGEYTSIRDTTHQYEGLNVPMKKQSDISSAITIGNDVWIGRGCMILSGTVIGEGVVIGANSVVKGTLEDYGIYAGSPATLIKSRKE